MSENSIIVIEDDAGVNNDESKDQILILRKLIYLVKPHLMLYQKKHKGYMNKSNKMQIWNNIGASLVPAITGE